VTVPRQAGGDDLAGGHLEVLAGQLRSLRAALRVFRDRPARPAQPSSPACSTPAAAAGVVVLGTLPRAAVASLEDPTGHAPAPVDLDALLGGGALLYPGLSW
jgi:hypothetical protein